MNDTPKMRYAVRTAKEEKHDIYEPKLNWQSVLHYYAFATRTLAEEYAALMLRLPEVTAVAIIEIHPGEPDYKQVPW